MEATTFSPEYAHNCHISSYLIIPQDEQREWDNRDFVEYSLSWSVQQLPPVTGDTNVKVTASSVREVMPVKGRTGALMGAEWGLLAEAPFPELAASGIDALVIFPSQSITLP